MRLLVSYSDDVGYHHERLLLYPIQDERWVVMTGDADVYDEAFADYATWEVMGLGAGRYPDAVENVVAFAQMPVARRRSSM